MHKSPCSGTAHGSKISVDNDINGSNSQVGSSSAVEREPSKPNKTGSKGEHERIVRAEVRQAMF